MALLRVPFVKTAGCRIGALVLAASAVAPPSGAVAAGDARANEYQVKAAILYNLAKFVEWPADAFANATQPLAICVVGLDPFGALLDDALRGHLVSGRAATVKRLDDVKADCHVLFVAASERRRLAAIIDQIGQASVLTVSDAEGFTDVGGIIGLSVDGERVRFDINTAGAERARLRLSARLMALASAVRRPREPAR